MGERFRARVVVAACLVIVALAGSTASATIHTSPERGVWGANGRVWAIRRIGGVIYLGGEFTAAVGPSGQHVARAHLMAVNASTGRLTAWNPGANGIVYAMAAYHDTLIAGGTFTRVHGQVRNRVVGIRKDGTLTGLRVNAGALVRSLSVSGSTLYLGGRFGQVNNQHRTHIAAVNIPSGGHLTPWHPSVNRAVRVIRALPTGQLIIGGVFTAVNGHPERYLAIFRSNGTLGDWAVHPDPDRWVEDIAQHEGMIVVAEAGQGGRVQVFNSSGHELWRVFCNGDVQAVSIADKKVIVGGHFLTVDLKPAPRLAALTFQGNLVTSWHPLPNKPVWTIRGSAKNVYVGGEFSKIELGGTTVGTDHFAEFDVK
ncbi:MAG: hypothetical protein ACJ758_09060 [Actinomycetota bacterium]|jgi:hypothetical protein